MMAKANRHSKILTISAVTLFTSDMERAVRFYADLGFELLHGDAGSDFVSFAVGASYLNLALRPDGAELPLWGRIIFYVSDVDALYERACALGLTPQTTPRDAPWGERFFHLRDPDGHELSFAKPLE